MYSSFSEFSREVFVSIESDGCMNLGIVFVVMESSSGGVRS